ncbi:UDP-N-acetylglucosamine 1-carboxyvinyltransferase [Marinicrinis lubricantis]|uniref:UDP-N-acetylglucosamine 1-carboxyvinyltransferase n=1 Tax=Marinicrinis lubricantis TaxID=2086470 RepID=A0ABW1ISK2_9BACL
MEKLVIQGGEPLAGTIHVHGSKNAALPILAAAVMVEGVHVIDNVPNLLDIQVMLQILREIGCKAEFSNGKIVLDTTHVHSSHIPEHLMSQMRSSIFLMGPLVSRFGHVQIYQPGGCAIGERKIDLHLRGLEALGGELKSSTDTIICQGNQLKGAEIVLDLPSVGATENIMMAAVRAEGVTVIHNAAREPEIQDLQNFLNQMGARIIGAGTSTITIQGVRQLSPCHYHVIPDRIVAGTVMIAAAATRGNVTLEGVNSQHLTSLTHVLRRAGVQVDVKGDIINVCSSRRPMAVDRIVTSPYPAFPTDLQAQIMTLLALSDGMSTIRETIFEGRFKHVDELCRMGADIRVDLNTAFIRGVRRLYGAAVEATDLRAGAALVIAGLSAKGTTVVEQIHHIDRGYENIEEMFGLLGANITRRTQTAKIVNN